MRTDGILRALNMMKTQFEMAQEAQPDWEKLLIKLEAYVEKFPREGELATIRRNISAWCRAAGEYGPGIYTLSVPTGGGKTFSSLRFALSQAEKYRQRRIFLPHSHEYNLGPKFKRY